MNPFAIFASLLAISVGVSQAILVQPHNYMLDDSSLIGSQQPEAGSLSPFYNDQSESGADKDIVSAISQGLERLRFGRTSMHDNSQDESEPSLGHFSAEMADLIQNEQQHQQAKQNNDHQASLSSSVAHVLMNVAHAAADVASGSSDDSPSGSSNNGAPILELDTSSSNAGHSALPSKSDLKTGPIQWYNPKETIPVLKISSMATPSKYKKVYFRSEKKLVDGAFHSPSNDKDEKRSLKKSFFSGVQRRSSRGTSSSVAPPGIFQDGFVEFLKKFRDVYVQTRPTGAASVSASALASPSSPFASVMSPASSLFLSTVDNALSAVSKATDKIGQGSGSSSTSGSSSSTGLTGAASSAVGSSSATSASGAGAASSPNKSPLSSQTYVSFWSKTFPNWVKKMLKQMRRRSLYNSSKRQQHQHQSHHSSAIGQASNANSVVDHSSSSSGSGSGSGSGSSSGSPSH